MNIENQGIELKLLWKDEYLKTICAFANTSGGILFLGKKDSGEIIGLKNYKKLLEDIPNKIVNMLGVYPEVNHFIKDDKDIIEIKIEKYQASVSYKGKFYIRSGSTTQELNGISLHNFLLKKSGKTWDELTEDDISLEDLDLLTIEKFKNLARNRIPSIINENDPMHILKSLNLIVNGKFKRAALLLFGKNPQSFYLNSYIKIGYFKTDTDLIFDDIIQGNLFKQIDTIFDLLVSKYVDKKISYNGIVRKDNLVYPFEALREAIINAIVHKDYCGVPIQISVYDDKMIIWNDGLLMPGITIENLKQKHISKPRNILLADIFYKAGFIEAWGRGTNNIIAEFKKYKLPEPIFSEKFNGVEIRFNRIISKTVSKSEIEFLGLNDRQAKSVKYVFENQRINNSEYQKINNCSRNTATKDLTILVEKKVFIKAGTIGVGVYYLIAH
ncbi:MAG: putative DNA binding domain-containing protein [Candidatus Cloacimonetes bacterium]|nr:putative DNA binding domain-containing protein [Candidatus Cloacimonadota bacterium]